VFERLSTVDFKTALEKYEFHKKSVKFLGFIIGTDGVKIDLGKIQSIKEWPTLRNVTDVQSFLGLANYNRKFIQDYSKKALLLIALTKKDTQFKWDRPQRRAFKQLKEACIVALTLRIFDPKLPIQIETDASDIVIGAYLT
jgi:hypothetical protein